MSEIGKTQTQCPRCAYWDRGVCRHGMTSEQEHARSQRCVFFSRDVSAFAFFVKEWRV